MNVWVELDQEDAETWVSIAGDDLALTESSTWKVEMYVSAQTTN